MVFISGLEVKGVEQCRGFSPKHGGMAAQTSRVHLGSVFWVQCKASIIFQCNGPKLCFWLRGYFK